MKKWFKIIWSIIHTYEIPVSSVVITRFFLILFFSFFSARSVFPSDSISYYKWSAIYRNNLELYRNSQSFSWNATLENSHLSDEIVLMAKGMNIKPFAIFLKCSTGRKDAESLDYKNMFYLKQGHVGIDLFREKFYLKAYLRERIYRSSMVLLPIVSNDSPYLTGNAVGVIAGIDNGRWVDISYTEARISEIKPEYYNGGLPDFNDPGGSFRLLNANLKWKKIGHFGLSVSETQSIQIGNGVTFGFSSGLNFYGIRALAEYSEKIDVSFLELNVKSLNGLDLKGFGKDGISDIFPDNSAFSMEVQGVRLKNPVLGSILFIPGYRYYGINYSNPEGEIGSSLVESYILSQWRHPHLAMAFKVKAGDIYSYDSNEGYKYIRNTLRMRLKTGFTLDGGLIVREGVRSSYLVTMEDDNQFSRLISTFRVDDCRGEEKISFLSDGWINISDLWMLRSSLYLYRSTDSRYSVSLEYRPSRRFLFMVSFGSFNPYSSAIALNQDWEPILSEKNRRICFFTRIWFGGIRD
ncbi:hypothetical protein J7M07_00035 [bacterium]|nr:hypothetical protein [bacterium]